MNLKVQCYFDPALQLTTDCSLCHDHGAISRKTEESRPLRSESETKLLIRLRPKTQLRTKLMVCGETLAYLKRAAAGGFAKVKFVLLPSFTKVLFCLLDLIFR